MELRFIISGSVNVLLLNLMLTFKQLATMLKYKLAFMCDLHAAYNTIYSNFFHKYPLSSLQGR
jgi:hypothetical protein